MAKRRGKGEGSIIQLSDGRWRAYLTVGYGPNGPQRKYFYAKTRREVQDKLADAGQNQRKGLPVVPERQTVGQFLENWLDTSARQRLRPNTLASYKDLVRLHLAPVLGHKPLARLSPQDIQALLVTKQAAGLSPRLVQYIRAVLRVALNQALKWGLVARNSATLVDTPRVQRKEVQPMTPDQAKTLLEVMEGDRLQALYTLAITTGLRRGELLGLGWENVNLDQGTLRVSNTLQRVNGRPQLVEPKTERSRRAVTMSRIAVKALRAHKTGQLEDRILAGSRWQETGLVFTSTIGTPLDGANVSHRFHALLRRAGLPHQRFHDLRRACASFLFAQGLPARMVMEVLGHSQIGTTMDIYAHVMPAMHQQAAEGMDAILAR